MTTEAALGSAALPNRWTASEISAALAERVEQLATDLVGAEPSHRGRTELRYYPRGGLVICTDAAKRGVWFSHADDATGDALSLVAFLRKCSVADALNWARNWLGLSDDAPRPAPAPLPQKRQAKDNGTIDLARRIWAEATDPADTAVNAYLRSRGLNLESDLPVRFHPACPRGSERLPAMIALMTDPVTHEPCGVHRTFLRSDGSGKADGTAKMMAGRAGVIRLSPDDTVTTGIGIAEGIETSLALIQLAAWTPIWACGSASGIAKFPALNGIECLTIFPDLDDSGAGIRAAEHCVKRWREASKETEICRPRAGNDWHDALTRKAA